MSDKADATWHPNSGPVTDHTDLIAPLDAQSRPRPLLERLDVMRVNATAREAAERIRHLETLMTIAPHDWKVCGIGDSDIDGEDDGICHCWKADL